MLTSRLILSIAAATSLLAQRITLEEAENLALKSSPQGRMNHLLSTAPGRTPSAYQPVVTTQMSGVTAGENTRLATGAGNSLTNPIIIPHVGVSLYASQLVTDFGRTTELQRAEASRGRAAAEARRQAEAALLYQVRVAFHALVRAVKLEQIAERPGAGATAEQRIQLALARNDRLIAAVDLAALIGVRAPAELEPVIPVAVEPDPEDVPRLVAAAVEQHPEAEQRRRLAEAARHEVSADARLYFPTLTAAATAGWVGARAARFPDRDFYHAAGLNVALPVLNWWQVSARRNDSRVRAEVAKTAVEEAENRIARNVTVAAIQVRSAVARAALARIRQRAAKTPAEEAAADTQLAHAEYEAGVQRAALELHRGAR